MAKIYGERWETIRSLGEGGQAHTYIVRDRTSDNSDDFVLKRLKNVGRLERFAQEIASLEQIKHPYVIRLVDSNLVAEKPYFVSEYCSGGSLADNPKIAELNPLKAFHVFRQICLGVAEAHHYKIVHRDIKPENILLRDKDGPAVVADFGIVYVENGKRQTLLDEAVGSRNFMSPELEDGLTDKVSPTSDIYSLRKLFYWLVSGGRIFSREKHRDSEFNLVDMDGVYGYKRMAFEHINELLDKMIAHEPSQRRQTVVEVLGDVNRAAYLVKGNYMPLSDKVQHICRYCGRANYELVVSQEGQNGSTYVSNFGFTPVSGNHPWRILRCPVCGHLEMFRIEPWWGK